MIKEFIVAGVGFNDILSLINNHSELKNNFKGFVDDNVTRKKNCKIVGKWKYLKHKKYLVFNSVCKNYFLREKAKKKLDGYQVKFINLISKNSNIKNAKLGKGNAIFDYVFLGDNVKIGDHTIVHNNVSVGHDTIIGRNCFLAPGVKILGRCKIEDNVFIGSNTVITNGVKIKKNSTIGSGCTIYEDIKANKRVFNYNKLLIIKNDKS